MKKLSIRFSCILSLILAIALFIPSFVAPVTAEAVEPGPILSGENEFGLDYADGVYTLNVDAEQLAALLQNRSFSKEYLSKLMPESLYGLLVNRDIESAMNLLKSLMDSAEIFELKDDLPIYLLKQFIEEYKVIELVDFDKFMEVIALNKIIGELTDEEFFSMFKEGKLNEILANMDHSLIFDEETCIKLLSSIPPRELNAMLKEGAIHRIITSGKIIFPELMTHAMLDKIIDEGHITPEELEDVLTDEVIKKVLGDKYLLNQILSYPPIKEIIDKNGISPVDPINSLKDAITDKSLFLKAIDLEYVFNNNIVDIISVVDQLDDEDLLDIYYKEHYTMQDLLDHTTDIGVITKELEPTKVPLETLFKFVSPSKFVQVAIEADAIAFIKALNIKNVIKLDQFETTIKSLSLAKLKECIDMDRLKGETLPAFMNLIATKLDYVKFNETVIYSKASLKLDVQALRGALYTAIPTVFDIMELGEDGLACSFVFEYLVDGKVYNLGFKVRFTGDTTALKKFAAKIAETVSYTADENGAINLNLKLTDKVVDLYTKAINSDLLPESLREKLINLDILNVESGKINATIDKILTKLSYDEFVKLLASVDAEKYADALLNKAGLSGSQAEAIRKMIIKAKELSEKALSHDKIADIYNKLFGIVSDIFAPETESPDGNVLGIDSLTDLYTGDGRFVFTKDFDVDLAKILPAKVCEFLTNTNLKNTITINVEAPDIRKVEFISNGEKAYTALVKVGTSLDTLNEAIAGKVWAAYENGTPVVYTESADKDLYLAELREATFYIKNTDGSLTLIGSAKFTELLDGTIEPPALDDYVIDGVELTWDKALDPKENKDLTATAFYTFKTEFKNGEEIIATMTYSDMPSFYAALENLDLEALLKSCEKRHYTAAFDPACFDENGKVIFGIKTVSVIQSAIEYTVIYNNHAGFAITGKDGSALVLKLTAENFTEQLKHFVEAADAYNRRYYKNARWTKGDKTVTANDISDWFTQPNSTLFGNETTLTLTAAHDPITYKVEFTGNRGEAYSFEFTIADYKTALDGLTLPKITQKTYYASKWVIDEKKTDFSFDMIKNWFENGTDTLFDSTSHTPAALKVSVVDTPIEFTLNFEGINDPIKFTVETLDGVKTPEAVPAEGFANAQWMVDSQAFDLKKLFDSGYFVTNTECNVRLDSYNHIYTITFEGVEDKFTYTEYDAVIDIIERLPKVPEKPGYTNGEWDIDYNTLHDGNYNKTVKAKYDIVTFNITIKYDDKDGTSVTVPFTVKTTLNALNKAIEEAIASIPENGWYVYISTVINEVPTEDTVIEAKAIAKKFTITFVDKDDNPVGEPITFDATSVFADIIKVPTEIPEYPGYNVAWPTPDAIEKIPSNITVKVNLTPINYTATFIGKNGDVIGTATFTVEDTEISGIPNLPEVIGYTASWEAYEIIPSDIEIKSVYSLITYKVTFVADGVTVAVVEYNVENTGITPPAVPEKDGYDGCWESYTLTHGDVTVNAVYTEAQSKSNNSLWWILLIILIIVLLVCIILFILLAKKKKDDDDQPDPEPTVETVQTPVVEEKPKHAPIVIPILEDVAAEDVDALMSDEDAMASIIVEDVVEYGGTGKKMFANIGQICEKFSAGDIVDIESLKAKNLVSDKAGRVKILADGHLDKPLTVKADDFSAQAAKMILLTGGKVIQLHPIDKKPEETTTDEE